MMLSGQLPVQAHFLSAGHHVSMTEDLSNLDINVNVAQLYDYS